MPRGDRTGPLGEGPQTGRGAGYCSGSNSPGYTTAPARPRLGLGRGGGRGRGFGGGRKGGFGRGRGRGRGAGRGFGFRSSYRNVDTDQAQENSEQDLDSMRDRLDRIEQDLTELKDQI